MNPNIKTKFLSGNPDFSKLKDEIWHNTETGRNYKPFARYIDYKERNLMELLYIYKEKEEKRKKSDCKYCFLWNKSKTVVEKFKEKDIHYQFRILSRIIVSLMIAMLLTALLSYMLLNGYVSFFIATIFLCIIFIPAQMVISLYKSIHIYKYRFDNSFENISESMCYRYSYELYYLSKQKVMCNYLTHSYKEGMVDEDDAEFISKLEPIIHNKRMERIAFVFKYNNMDYKLIVKE